MSSSPRPSGGGGGGKQATSKPQPRSMSISTLMKASSSPGRKSNPLQGDTRTPRSRGGGRSEVRRSSKGSGDGRRHSVLSDPEASTEQMLPAPLVTKRSSEDPAAESGFGGSATLASDEDGLGSTGGMYDDIDEDEGVDSREDEAYDPSVLWLVSRGTQCVTPDVDMSHPNFRGYKKGMAADEATDFTVFCISVADYNARQHGLQIADDEDSEEEYVSPSRRRLSYHGTAPAGTVIVRVAGNTYGFTDGQKSAKPVPAPWVDKGVHRQTQTKDQRIFNKTVFVPKEVPVSVTVSNPSTTTAHEKSKARRRSKNEMAANRAAEAKRVSIQPAIEPMGSSQTKDDHDKLGSGSANATAANKDATPKLPLPAVGPGASLSTAKPHKPFSFPKRVSKGSGNATSALVVAVMQLPKEADPSNKYQWIDGIGNVPKRDPFYDTLLQPRPRPRPSSAAVAAAMNQDDAVVHQVAPAPNTARDADPPPNGPATRRGSRADALQDSFEHGRTSVTVAGSRRDSLSASASGGMRSPMNAPADSEGLDNTGIVSPVDEAKGLEVSDQGQIANMFEVEPRKLPPLPPNMRRAVVQSREGALAVNRADPWADTPLQYDPTKLQPSKKKSTPAKLVVKPPTSLVTHSTELHAIDSRKTSIPALGPDSALDASVVMNNSSMLPHPREKPVKLPPAKHASDAAGNDHQKSQKQMLIDRDKEFAKLFPDWIINDDRYRPSTSKLSARASRR